MLVCVHLKLASLLLSSCNSYAVSMSLPEFLLGHIPSFIGADARDAQVYRLVCDIVPHMHDILNDILIDPAMGFLMRNVELPVQQYLPEVVNRLYELQTLAALDRKWRTAIAMRMQTHFKMRNYQIYRIFMVNGNVLTYWKRSLMNLSDIARDLLEFYDVQRYQDMLERLSHYMDRRWDTAMLCSIFRNKNYSYLDGLEQMSPFELPPVEDQEASDTHS